MQSKVVALLSALAFFALSPTLRADQAPVEAKLEFSVGPAVVGCPDAAVLRELVTTRLGYDPFRSTEAPKTVFVNIARKGTRLVARVSLRAEDGSVNARQPLDTSAGGCTEMASTLAFAVSIAIDPRRFLAPLPVPVPHIEVASPIEAVSPVEAAPPGRAAPHVKAPSPLEEAFPSETEADDQLAAPVLRQPEVLPPPTERAAPEPLRALVTPLRLGAGAGFFASTQVLPATSFAPALRVRAARGRAAIDVEGRYELPVEQQRVVGSIRVSLLQVSLAPCYEARGWVGCALVSVGRMAGEGRDIAHPYEDATVYWAAGARVGYRIALDKTSDIRLELEGRAPLRPTRFTLSQTEVWETPDVSASAGLSVNRDLF